MSKSNAAKRGARLLALALVLRCGPAAASPPHMVKDVDDATVGSVDQMLGEAGGLFYFSAGGYLQRSDGTKEGTFPLRPAFDVNPACTAALGSVFLACGIHGLVRTDGTVAGTTSLMPLHHGDGRLARLGSYVYFDASVSPFTRLGRTDGTPAGTSVYWDLGANDRRIPHLYATSDRVYFDAKAGASDGLWVSDGGAAPPVYLGAFKLEGAMPVGSRFFFVTNGAAASRDLWVTSGGPPEHLRTFPAGHGRPDGFTALGGRLLFHAGNEFGRAPWISDGTVAGTSMVLDVVPGDPWYGGFDFKVLGGTAFFLVGGDLWKTDGSPGGTGVVLAGLGIQGIVGGRTRLVLTRTMDSPLAPVSATLWVTDGTAAGTTLVRSSSDRDFLLPFQGTELGGRIYFPYSTPRYGLEIWGTDGTPEGTGILVDLGTRTGGGGPTAMVAGTTKAYFHQSYQGLWSTDGTGAGTQPVTKGGVQLAGGEGTSILVSGDTGFACGTNGLWRTDGTEPGTARLTAEGQQCLWAVWSGAQIYFALSESATGFSLWRTGGTVDSTMQVSALTVNPHGASAFGSGILFTGARADTGIELWISDGTAAGTRLVRDIVPGPNSGIMIPPIGAGPIAFFRGGPNFFELWRTDGTEEGTFAVLPAGLTVFWLGGQIDGIAYFAGASSEDWQVALWRSDGTPEGTRPLRSFMYMDASAGGGPVVSNGKVFFVAGDPIRGLWVSDGTGAGTRRVMAATYPEALAPVAGGLAYTGGGGPAFTDGTNEGTLELPIAGADWYASAYALGGYVRLGSMLLFGAVDGIHGRELWRADLENTGRMFYTVAPCRVVDTRFNEGGSTLLEDLSRDFQVAGRCGVPSDATGVVLNLTGTQSTIDGYFEAGPAERWATGTRTTAFRTGQTRASCLTLGLDPASGGRISLKLNPRDEVPPVYPPAGKADVILDVSGYFR